jgi:hypothetical protein
VWWSLVPKFAGSNLAEAVGFLRVKNPQHAFLRRGSKAVGPMSDLWHVKDPKLRELRRHVGKITRHFSPIVPPFDLLGR